MTKTRIIPVAVCALVALCATLTFEEFWPSKQQASAEATPLSPGNTEIPATVRSLRPNFPYSVIPGGVYAPHELRSAMRSDPTVRLHYAMFNAAQVRFVTLAADSYRYVSYRVGNQIYWTRKQLRIPRGEVLLTDGRNFARSRCGNRLAEEPEAETSPLEPTADALSQPPFTVNDGRPDNAANGGVLGQELLSSVEELPISPSSWRYAEVIPDVHTGAEAAPNVSRSLPNQTMSPWIPPLIVVYQSPLRNSGGGTTSPAAPILPVPAPEPDKLALVSSFLLGLWWLRRPKTRVAG